MVAAGGVEPPSLDYQSSALSLSYTAAVVFDLRPSVFDRLVPSMNRGPKTNVVVDPAGLKPAPHGLKGRCSVTRAPDQKIGCGGRIRTFGSRINSAVPYQLGDATKRK